MKKTISLLLSLLMLASSLAACSDTTSTETNAGNTPPTPVESTSPAETESSKLPLGLAEGLSFNNATVNVLTPTATSEDSFILESNGDIVNDALYNRDRTVEELLDVVIHPIPYKEGSVTTLDHAGLEKSVLAGDDLYSFMHLGASTFFANRPTYEKILLNVADDANLSLSSPWWNETAIRELSYNGKSIKYLIGDISLSSISGASAIFYNKTMFDSLYHNAEQPYNDVLEGTWTIDKFGEYASGAYVDVDGGGVVDEDDTFGAKVNQWMVQSFYNGFSDAQFYTRDADGYVQLDIDLDRAVTLGEKLYNLIWNNQGVLFVSDGQYHTTAVAQFSQNKLLFLTNFLSAIEKSEMREMESDYGILPFYKLDEQQAEYRTDLNPSGTQWVCIPTTCSDVNMATAVIEALSYTGFYDVTPTYYEEALKSKYIRDSLSGQVIDMLRDSLRSDYLIGIYRSTIGQHFANEVHQKRQEFASSWQKQVKIYQKTMEKNYKDLDEAAQQ